MALLLNRYTAVGLVVMTVLGATFIAGDKYGWNSRHYAACKAETARRNDAVARGNAAEETKRLEDEARWAKERAAFDKIAPAIGQCLLTGDQAAALNGIGE